MIYKNTGHKNLPINYFASRAKWWAEPSPAETYKTYVCLNILGESDHTRLSYWLTCFIPGLCQLSRTGWHLSEACQPPGGTEEATGSREAVEQRLVQEILKRCVIKLNYLQWPVCDWTIITTIIIMYNLTFSVGCCTDTLIIRNERGIYNNDINWRSRYLCFFL